MDSIIVKLLTIEKIYTYLNDPDFIIKIHGNILTKHCHLAHSWIIGGRIALGPIRGEGAV